MIKTIPSKEEMKLLVKRIYETSSKLNGNIPIANIDDAANMAAYLYNFSSWKEYQSVHKAEYEEKFKDEFSVKLPKFKPQNYKKGKTFLSTMQKNNSIVEPELKTSSLLPLEWLIGKKKNVIAKVEEPVGLLTEDYIVTSAPILAASNMLENQIKWLIKYQQTFMLFGLNNKISNANFLDIWQQEKILQLGKNGFKIDPIEESFEGEGFESMLGIKPFGEHQAFPWVWAMMIRTLRDELNIKWTASNLLDSLKLENLLQLTEQIKLLNPLVAKPLHQYLFKQCGIMQDEDSYIASEEGQARHYHQIYLLKEKLEKLEELYHLGYFSEATNVSITGCVMEKKSAVILNCEEEKLSKYYWDVCATIYVNALRKQNKATTNLDTRNYKIWSIWWSAENVLSEEIIEDLIDNKSTAILGFYILSASHNLEKLFLNTRQILFLRQQFSNYPQNWINKALNNTEYWEDNIWLDNFSLFKEIANNKAYIWRPKSILVPSDLEYYELKKIDLYNKDPIEK